ncbi:MAG: TMEM175 family protein [Flavobacteriales bacterium]
MDRSKKPKGDGGPRVHMRMGPERLLAFSDGVLAIVITLMILEIKLPAVPHGATSDQVRSAFSSLWPHLAAYALSFLLLALFWINHHSLFLSVRGSTNALLWHNCHVLFWVSLVPLTTAFLGEHPELPQATLYYGIVQMAILFSSNLMIWHMARKRLFDEQLSPTVQRYYARLNGTTAGLTLLATFAGYVSTWLAIGVYLVIVALYFLPRPIELVDKEERGE